MTVEELLQDRARLVWLIRQVYSDLPAKRDWLDPVLEQHMAEIAKQMKGAT